MSEGKLVVCVCGAGVNTSTNARLQMTEQLEKRKIYDTEVVAIDVTQLEKYSGRKNMVVVWMCGIDTTFDAPAVQGLQFLIGTRAQKQEIAQKVMELMDEIYQE